MDKSIKNPAIRFKGFIEDWKESNFDNAFTGLSNNTLSRADLNYKFGLGKNIHYGDVLIKFKEILDVQNNEIPFITNSQIVDKFKGSKLQNGDIIIADAAEDETVGKCTEITNIDNELIFSGLHTIAVRPTFEFAENYLGYYLNSPAYHNQLLRLMQGTKVFSISKSAIKNTVILHPNNTTEQKHIGTYFQNLDNLITLHQKKYDKLIILKKAMLVKMFPQKGEVVPEIRFKGFTEDWKEDKLGNIFNFQYGIFNNNPSNGGEFPVYGANGIIGGYTDYNAENSIIIGHMGEYAGIVLWENGKHFVTYNGIITKPKNEKILVKYGYFMLFKLNLRKICGGSGQPFLSYNTLNSISSIYPKSLDEQKKIGFYFQNIDHQIALHKTQLDKLNNIKKACFSKMFVAQD